MKFCMECGKERTAIIQKVKEMPTEISDIVERINFVIENGTSDEPVSTKEESVIRALGDIKNIDPDFKGRIYATGSISFAPRQMSKLKLSFSGDVLEDEPAYRTVIAIRREENPSRHISVYTDVGHYKLHNIGDQDMRTVSRNLVVIVAHGNSFYVYGKDIKPGYLKIHDDPVNDNTITQLNPNELIRLGPSLTVRA